MILIIVHDHLPISVGKSPVHYNHHLGKVHTLLLIIFHIILNWGLNGWGYLLWGVCQALMRNIIDLGVPILWWCDFDISFSVQCSSESLMLFMHVPTYVWTRRDLLVPTSPPCMSTWNFPPWSQQGIYLISKSKFVTCPVSRTGTLDQSLLPANWCWPSLLGHHLSKVPHCHDFHGKNSQLELSRRNLATVIQCVANRSLPYSQGYLHVGWPI